MDDRFALARCVEFLPTEEWMEIPFSMREQGNEIEHIGWKVSTVNGKLLVQYADKQHKFATLTIRRYPHHASAMPFTCIIGCIMGRIFEIVESSDEQVLDQGIIDTIKTIANRGYSLGEIEQGLRKFVQRKRPTPAMKRRLMELIEKGVKQARADNPVQTSTFDLRRYAFSNPHNVLCSFNAMLNIIRVICEKSFWRRMLEKCAWGTKLLEMLDTAGTTERSLQLRYELRDEMKKEHPDKFDRNNWVAVGDVLDWTFTRICDNLTRAKQAAQGAERNIINSYLNAYKESMGIKNETFVVCPRCKGEVIEESIQVPVQLYTTHPNITTQTSYNEDNLRIEHNKFPNWKCTICNTTGEAQRGTRLYNHGRFIIIELQRHEFTAKGQQKRKYAFKIDRQVEVGGKVYSVDAMIHFDHSHCTNTIRCGSQWISANNTAVDRIHPAYALNSRTTAYILLSREPNNITESNPSQAPSHSSAASTATQRVPNRPMLTHITVSSGTSSPAMLTPPSSIADDDTASFPASPAAAAASSFSVSHASKPPPKPRAKGGAGDRRRRYNPHQGKKNNGKNFWPNSPHWKNVPHRKYKQQPFRMGKMSGRGRSTDRYFSGPSSRGRGSGNGYPSYYNNNNNSRYDNHRNFEHHNRFDYFNRRKGQHSHTNVEFFNS
jgi:hypothetical protein